MIIQANSYRGRVVVMKPPRVVYTKHLMGRPLGAPFDVERQTHVLREALKMLETATKPETSIVLPEMYRLPPKKS